MTWDSVSRIYSVSNIDPGNVFRDFFVTPTSYVMLLYWVLTQSSLLILFRSVATHVLLLYCEHPKKNVRMYLRNL